MYIFQISILLVILTVCAVTLGRYMAKVFSGEKTLLSFLIRPVEKLFYRWAGIDEKKEMSWKEYAFLFIIFNVIGIVVVFLIQEFQHILPLNPQNLPPVRWDTAINTAISFVTNTNWQSYNCEQTMSYFTQMTALTVQNFLSAAAGLGAAIAFFRGFARQSSSTIGNFWLDLTRSVLYILLPLALVFSIILVSQGVIQNFKPYVHAGTLEGKEQLIAQGPAASQIAIKILGTNGGGFFNANSAHPYEDPNPLTDYLQILGFLVIAAALPFTFGKMLGKEKQGWVFFTCMLILYIFGLAIALHYEFKGNPLLAKAGVVGGLNMEGKEVRNGILSSVVFAQSTTATSCGAVNCMHDSLLPITGMVLFFNMAVGEVIFGGVGVGIIGLLQYAILGMFLIGLMIGRTPEILGKKLEPFEMAMTMLAIVLPSVFQLVLGAAAISSKETLASLGNAGPHGLSEIIYAFASAAGNNGSAFAGLNANTVFYNLTLALTILIGRLATILPALAIAGSLAGKKMVPESARFPSTGLLFILMLVGVVIIVGGLTFFPVLVLGPFLEHLFLGIGKVF